MAKARYRAGSLLWNTTLPEDARTSFKSALALFETAGDRLGVSLTTTDLGMIAHQQGDFDSALSLATAALDEARDLDDAQGLWYATCLAGNVHQERGDLHTGKDFHLEAIRHAQDTGYSFPVHVARGGLGWNQLMCADFAGARETFCEYLTHLSPRNTADRAWGLCNLGWAALCLANTDEARACFSESLFLATDVRWLPLAAEILIALAALRTEDGAAAATLWGSARRLRDECGVAPTAFERSIEAERLEPVRDAYGAEFELGTTLGLDKAVELALSGP
jgi:tetratricopeptide (TPR) repeat protein